MPQITLEYTDNVGAPDDLDGLFAELHRILSEVGGIRIENCKSRAVALRDYRVGEGEKAGAFVHLEVAILDGRSLELRQKLGGEMLGALEAAFRTASDDLDLQITVEVREMPKDLYFKLPEGTFTP